MEQIADRAIGAYAVRPAVTAEDIGSYEAVKDKLMIQLIGREGNEEMLRTIPHHSIEDMEIVYRFPRSGYRAGNGFGAGDKFHAGALWNYSRTVETVMLLSRQSPTILLRLKPWRKS